jgi:hypothetical protein
MDSHELDARLRELLDKQAIHEVIVRYCRGVDRRDRGLIEGAFHFESPEDFEPRVGGPRLADYMEGFGAAACHTHFIGNQLIEVLGDTAWAETYFTSIHPRVVDGVDCTAFRGGRYLDRLENRSGEWKIVERMKIDDWDRLDPVSGKLSGIADHLGTIAPNDPSYEFIARARGDGDTVAKEK